MSQNYKYNKVTMNRFAIKGELSNDGKTIAYINGDKEEKIISVNKCFSKFCGQPIELIITLKTEENLCDEFMEE